jgi:hypothetical protein
MSKPFDSRNQVSDIADHPGIIERAFQIAKGGGIDIGATRRQLEAEGYANVVSGLAGRSLQRQLLQLISEAGPGPEL